MLRQVILGSVFLGALGWSVPALAQTTVKLQQGSNGYTGAMDTYIDKFMPTDFYGGVDRIEVRHYDPGSGLTEKQNTLILFDVTSIPSGATVTAAKLTMYNTRANSNSAADILILEKVTSAWNNQSTWSMGVPSAVSSGVTCPPVDTLTMSPATPEVYTITGLASLVQGWMASPATNYGIMLSCTSNVNLRWASSEYATQQYRPTLEVTYTTGPPPTPPPAVTVNAPPANATSSPLTMTGSASATSPATVTTVTWSNALSGATGTATGTTSWTASVPLVNGYNPITITVTDSTGATTTSSTFTVRYAVPGAKSGGGHKPCGFGVAGGSPDWIAVAALILLLAAASWRPR